MSILELDYKQVRRAQLILGRSKTIVPSAVCCVCAKILYVTDVQWIPTNDFPRANWHALKLVPPGSPVTVVEKNQKVSACRECKFKAKCGGASTKVFDDFGSIPDEIKTLPSYEAFRKLSIGTLFCSTFKPPGYTYMHNKGSITFGATPEKFRGMLGILYDGNDPEIPVAIPPVRKALIWLKQNNPLYRIFLPVIETLLGYFAPCKANSTFPGLPKYTPDLDISKGGQLSADEIRRQSGLIIPATDVIGPHEGIQADQIEAGIQLRLDDELTVLAKQEKLTFGDHHLEAKIFPHLFPWGRGSWFRDHTCDALSLGQYHKLRLLHVDRRWANDRYYLFYAFDRNMKSRIMAYNSMVSSSSSKRKKTLTAGDAIQSESRYYNCGKVIPANVTGSKNYWKSKWLDLVAMVQALGTADLFVTLTANDAWEPMKDILKQYPNKASILHPVDTTVYFFQRFNQLKPLLFGSQSVFGEVTDHWYRVEAQNRGALHIHMLLWVKKGTLKEDAISAQIPRGTDVYSKQLAELVKRLQIHHCRPNRCYRTWKGEATDSCKYGFPFTLRDDDGYDMTGLRYEYKRTHKDDAAVVPYNPYLLLAWQAHVNVQLVTRTGLERYLVKYIAKVEPTFGLKIKHDNEVDTYLESRLIGGPEAVAYSLSYHIVSSTKQVLFIDTNLPDDRSRLMKSKRKLEESEGDSTDIYMMSPRDRYVQRPRTVPFDTMTLPDYVCQYEVLTNAAKKVPKSRQDNVCEDQKGNRVVKRSTVLVPRYRFLTPLEGEAFYFQQLLLHTGYYNESDLVSVENETKTYKEECYIRNVFGETDDIDNALREMKNRNFEPEQIAKVARRMLLEQMCDKKTMTEKLSKLEYGDSLVWDGGDDDVVDCPGICIDNNMHDSDMFPEIIQMLKCNRESILGEQTDLRQRVQNLTCSQKQVFDFVSSAEKQTLAFVTGPGGTGKSFLLHTMALHYEFSGKIVEILATSGNAAKLVGGQTIHALFGLNTDLESRMQFADSIWENVSCTEVLIIDEVSMMTGEMLETIDFLCRKVAGDSCSTPFGGKTVILLGDLFQLPAVVSSLSQTRQIYESTLWSYFKPFFLRDNCRQVSDPQFADILLRIRVGEQTPQDLEILQSRVCSTGHPATAACSSMLEGKSVVICSKHTTRKQINNQIQDSLLSIAPYYSLIANDYDASGVSLPSVESQVIDRMAGCMPSRLNIRKGARVMITRNLDIQAGVVNGTTGTLVTVHSKVLIVQTPEGTVIPVPRVRQKFTLRATTSTVYRVQFPVILAWACTVHRIQGTTLDQAHIALDDSFFADGQAYVALSRVKSLDKLHLLSLSEKAFRTSAVVRRLMQTAESSGELASCPADRNKPSIIGVADEPTCSNTTHSSVSDPIAALVVTGLPAVENKSRLTPSVTVAATAQDTESTYVSYTKTILKKLKLSMFGSSLQKTEITQKLDMHLPVMTDILAYVHENRSFFDPIVHVKAPGVMNLCSEHFLEHFTPVQTTGDGNCLWNTVSISLCGSEKLTVVLRLVTLKILLQHYDYLSHLQLATEVGGEHVVDEAIRTARKWRAWGSEYHLLALTIALQKPIFIYSGFRPESRGLTSANALLDMFSTRHPAIRGHLLYEPPHHLKEARYSNIPVCGFYVGSHYTCLLPNDSNSMIFTPVTSLFNLLT